MIIIYISMANLIVQRPGVNRGANNLCDYRLHPFAAIMKMRSINLNKNRM